MCSGMLRCKTCKKWLKNVTTAVDVEDDGAVIHAVNVPAKRCPQCGAVAVYGIVQDRIVQYALQRGAADIDYAECENEEATAGQLLF